MHSRVICCCQVWSISCIQKTQTNLVKIILIKPKRVHISHCQRECHGEKSNSESPYNMASREEVNLDICIFLHGIKSRILHLSNKKHICQVWVNKIFDLRTWTAGMCYTYNPPNKSDTLLTSRFYYNDIHILKEILNEYFQNFFKQTHCSCWRGWHWRLSLPIGRF